MDFSQWRDGLQMLRDVALVVVALESIVVGVVVLVLLIQLVPLVGLLRRQITQLSGLAAETLSVTAEVARSVRGTTAFVGDRATRPLIEVLAAVTAASRFARAVFSSNHEGDGKK